MSLKRWLFKAALLAAVIPSSVYAADPELLANQRPTVPVAVNQQIPHELAVVARAGSLSVRVTPAAAVNVFLVGFNGTSISAATDGSGVATFNGVTPNSLYAAVVAEPGMHAVVPIMVLDEVTATAKNVSTDIAAVRVVRTSPQEVLKSIAGYTGYRTSGGAIFGVDHLGSSIDDVYRVQLSASGTLTGRVLIPESPIADDMRYMNITLLRNGQPIAQTTSNAITGEFSFNDVGAGEYGLIAAGPAGYAAYSFEALAAVSKVTRRNADGSIFVVAAAQPASGLTVVAVPPAMLPPVISGIQTSYQEEVPPPAIVMGDPLMGPPVGFGGFPGGGFPGGGGGAIGGGGGALSGLGGLGPLIGLGALGGIAAAIASDDGTNFVTPINPASATSAAVTP